MSKPLRPRSATIFLVGAVLCPFLGCGKVGDPLPPRVEIPRRVTDLIARQGGNQIALAFTLPTLNTDGSTATTISRVEIYRGVSQGPIQLGNLPEFKDLTLLASLKKEQVETPGSAGKVTYADSLKDLPSPRSGDTILAYSVRVFNRKDQTAGYGKSVLLQLIADPSPPASVQVSSLGEGFIEIHWLPPTTNLDGSPVAEPMKYYVYRSGNPKSLPGDRLTPQPLEETTFKDQSISLDVPYFYTVRTMVEGPSGDVESVDSAVLQVSNPDTYPPAAPADLAAISDGTAVSLIWTPNTENDLAGYLVFRRTTETREIPLADTPIPHSSFSDKLIEPGKTYFYRVQAVDSHGNKSEYSLEVSESIP